MLTTVDPLPAEIVARLTDEDFDALVEAIVDADMQIAFAAHRSDLAFREILTTGVRENVSSLRRLLSGDVALTDVAPVVPLSVATLQAQIGVSEADLQRSYRVGSVTATRWWFDIVRDRFSSAPDALEIAERFVAIALALQDRLLQDVGSAFLEELHILRRSQARIREEMVLRLIRGEDIGDADELATGLGYELNATHMAAFVTARAEDVRPLLSALLAVPSVAWTYTLQLAAGSQAIWLAGPNGWNAREQRQIVEIFEHHGAVTSLGSPASGLTGFRRTFEDAREVDAFQSLVVGTSVVGVATHEHIRLELLLARDPAAVHEFASAELGPLAGDGRGAEAARSALLAWYETGSHVGAAARLGVHEHTVRNRLARAESLIGRALDRRRPQTQAALRLHRFTSSFDHPTHPGLHL